MKNYTEEELEEWINRIDDVNKKVKDIIDGTVEVEEIDRQEREQEYTRKTLIEINAREKQEKLVKGRPGKGHLGGYKTFCKFCFTEFLIDLDKCSHCNHDTMTYQERLEELKDKIEDHKIRIQKKKERKSKWDNWKKTQALFYKKTSTNYKKWDFFESGDEDSEEDNSDPILPTNDPQFRAMEQDMLDRKKRRQRDKKEADVLRERGNEVLKKGLYKSAIKYYSDALELRKDILCLYTNRALARLKIEDFTGVIDDCTRVLEYCDCFHDGYTKEKDLCYKALMRRCQAYRGQKDYKLALTDLIEAEKLTPGDKDIARFTKLTEEDIEHEQKITNIMSNANLLKGKEYLDFILDFLQGKKDETLPKEKKFCYYDLQQEDADKIKEILLSDQDMIYYFNVKNGFKTLVDSLSFNTNALAIIQPVLDSDVKLQEDFQKQKHFEQLIDFLNKQNANTEAKTLDSPVIHKVLEILESASLNEYVRENLSEKKKIKDLFLVVIKAIDVPTNMKLVSSLIQFVSNLCYGNGKFRTMLRSESTQAFFQTLRDILKSTNQEEKDEKHIIADKVLLKHALLAFIGNLCVDNNLRQTVAGNIEGILEEIYNEFEKDLNQRQLLWLESINRELGILINVCLEPKAQAFLINKNVVKGLEKLITGMQYKGEEIEIVNRIINLLSKIARDPNGALQIAESKDIVLRVLIYFNRNFPQLVFNCLRIFHALCRVPDFRSICLDLHKFNPKNFDTYVNEVVALFNESLSENQMDNFINCCSSVSAFGDVLPERMNDFQGLIVPLISIVKEKTDMVRKNAAVCLAKLCKNEENALVMRQNHGTEVLVSLGNVLSKQV
eukprot:403333259